MIAGEGMISSMGFVNDEAQAVEGFQMGMAR
jgi:hypothetical protein